MRKEPRSPIKVGFLKVYEAHCKEYGITISAVAPTLEDAKKKLRDFFTHANECGVELIFHNEANHE